MEQIERIIRLHNLLSDARRPMSRAALQERLASSAKTFRRDIDFLRDRLGAPVEYSSENNGWYYREKEAALYELPGLWLNEREIHALLTIEQLLSHLDPEVLHDEIAPFSQRIRKLLEQTTGLPADEDISQYIELLSTGKRKRQYQHFQDIASATLKHKQIHISYHGRGKNARSERTLSPVQLLYYRENWYLSAWCHSKADMRIFSLDKIESFEQLDAPAKSIDMQTAKAHISGSFGIFTGAAQEYAVLEFSEEASRWVADEIWHPEQKGEWLNETSYRLTVPYSNPIELSGEILRHGEGIKVIAPDSLRELVIKRLGKALSVYN